MLSALYEFNGKVAGLFKFNHSIKKALKGLLGALGQTKVGVNGVSLGKDYNHYLEKLTTTLLMKNPSLNDYVKKMTHGASKNDERVIKSKLLFQNRDLTNDGWDWAARKAYFSDSLEHHHKDEKYLQTLERQWQRVHRVGSNVYTKMLKSSHLSAKTLVTNLIERHLGGKIDPNNFLQLNADRKAKYHLDEKISPLNSLFPTIRDLVVQTFPKDKTLKDVSRENTDNLGQLATEVHLFRSYLDRSYLKYIQSYQGKDGKLKQATDYQRLQQFIKDYHLEADYGTGANAHNRRLKDYPENMKVQLMKDSKNKRGNNARMIEFIVNLKDGHFVSEWNAYDKHTIDGQIDFNVSNYSDDELKGIADTESFNYGVPIGTGNAKVAGMYQKSHSNLDYSHPADSVIREKATEKYSSPRDYDKTDKKTGERGNYADIVKQEKDIQAWNSVPDSEKAATYHKFVKWKRRFEPRKSVSGISAIIDKTN